MPICGMGRLRGGLEQKEHAVRLFALREELGTSSGTVTRVANQLGYGVESVRKWVAQAEIDTGARAGLRQDYRRARRGRGWGCRQDFHRPSRR